MEVNPERRLGKIIMRKNILAERKVPMNKKGQIGMNLVKNVMVSFLILGVIFVAIVLGLVELRDAGLFTPGSPEAVSVNNSIRNMLLITEQQILKQQKEEEIESSRYQEEDIEEDNE